MNYIGSKNKLSEFIKSGILKTIGKSENIVFADIFSGTGQVSRIFKKEVRELISNDLEPYSYHLLMNYIGNNQAFDSTDLLDQLNALPGKEGFIFKHYCAGGENTRLYFSDENGKKIDAIRIQLKQWLDQQYINPSQFYFLLASLLESADKVANTASVYAAFLKHLKKSALKPMLISPALFEESNTICHVYNEDANALIRKIKGDVLYLDPPYNGRQYGSNYHILNTITLYDEFEPKGKTGLREYPKSDYCKKSRVGEVFEDLIREADFEFIFLSYNNEGLLNDMALKKLLSQFGKYSLISTFYQRFKADKDHNRIHKAIKTVENLHILRKK